MFICIFTFSVKVLRRILISKFLYISLSLKEENSLIFSTGSWPENTDLLVAFNNKYIQTIDIAFQNVSQVYRKINTQVTTKELVQLIQ